MLDVRVAIIPTYFGENAVLRLLFPLKDVATLTSLGMSIRDQNIVLRALAKPHGLILSAGPTGSGKTSTLYALLHLLAVPSRSIITIEDPIEYSFPEITQIQTNERVGLTFATGLRSVLRQDPDTIMVGEIRDQETARLAINAALTGHTVLSSLHTNDSPTTVPRLFDLSIEPYLIPSTLQLVIAQRLVRRICSACRTERKLSSKEREAIVTWSARENIEFPAKHFKGAGCAACSGSGYRGRIGVFELMTMDDRMRESVLTRPSTSQLRTLAQAQGMRTLISEGMDKVRDGMTTLEELTRLSHE